MRLPTAPVRLGCFSIISTEIQQQTVYFRTCGQVGTNYDNNEQKLLTHRYILFSLQYDNALRDTMYLLYTFNRGGQRLG